MHIEELPFVAPHELFRRFAQETYALLLDSSSAGPDRDPELHGRWSFIACDPFDTLNWHAGETPGDPFAVLKRRLAEYPPLPPVLKDAPAFLGGAAGFIGYDMAQALETLPPRRPPFAIDDQHLPDMALGFYDLVLAFDMVARRCLLVSTGWPEKDETSRHARAQERAAHLRNRMGHLPPPAMIACAAPAKSHDIKSGFTPEGYKAAVQKVIDYVHAGDVFQVNLSQRFETLLPQDDTPYALYIRLRNESPAPFAAFFNFGDACLVSSSPERFLQCTPHGEVATKPIKGTRPRGETAEKDLALSAALLASEKDRAENVMIVDLLRNDLSRACEDRSVTVEKLCALESFSNVHHLVSTVRGRLRADKNAVDLLSACFPGGSITGTPKPRAMEIIAEIEPTTRGPYCGSIGYIGGDGAMDMSIAIRTMLVRNNHVSFQAGGGITAQSDPAAEYEETLDKARAMIAALSGMPAAKDEAEVMS